MNRKIVLTLLLMLLSLTGCNTVDPPPGDKPTLALKLEDVSCTEAWIELTTTNLQLPATITLKQTNPTGDTRTHISILNTKDSLLYVDSLLPNQSYTFIASHSSAIGGLSGISSNELSVTTMDTTSHDFTFETFTFGGTAGSSTLYDVAIISPENIWCVGEINIADTSINGYTTYNAVHWDGSQWNLKKITVTFRGNLITPPLEGAFAFSSTDIWFVGSLPIHGDGENWIMYDLRTTVDPNITVSKAWGSISNDMYFVGRNGSIARYINGTWSRIVSGTDVNLRDVWGSPDGSIVWVAGFEDSYGTVFLRNTGNGFEKVLEITDPNMPHPPNQITYVFKSLWTDNANTVYLGAVGRVYAAPKNTTGYAKENIWWDYANQKNWPPATNVIRGIAGNDIFVGGYLQFIQHWNGASWKGYPEIEGDGTWRGMAVKDNLFIAVGENFSVHGSARIARGYRIK